MERWNVWPNSVEPHLAKRRVDWQCSGSLGPTVCYPPPTCHEVGVAPQKNISFNHLALDQTVDPDRIPENITHHARAHLNTWYLQRQRFERLTKLITTPWSQMAATTSSSDVVIPTQLLLLHHTHRGSDH